MARLSYQTRILAAFLFVGLPVFAGNLKPAYAITVTAPATDQRLDLYMPQIISAINELTAAQMTTNQLLERLNAAIGAPGPTMAGADFLQDLTLDSNTFSTIVPGVADLPGTGSGSPLPDFTQFEAMRQQLTNTYSLITKVSEAIKDGEVPSPQTFDQIMTIKGNIEQMQRSRAEAAYAFSLYSLQTGPEAKAAEQSLKAVVRGTPSLRADTKANSSAVLTLLERVNHLIALSSNQSAADTANDIATLPWMPTETTRQPDAIKDPSRLPQKLIKRGD